MAHHNTKESESTQTKILATDTTRSEQGRLGTFVYGLCIVTSLFHLWVNTFGSMSEIWRNSLHMGLLGLIGFLLYPIVRKPTFRWVLGIDIVLGLLVLAAGFYLVFMEEALFERNQEMIFSDMLFSLVAIVLALELCRRTTGFVIPSLGILFLSYLLIWGDWITGPFRFRGLSLETVLYRMYFTEEGLFGLTANISSTFVFMFILFAAFLLKSGGGEFIIRLASVATRGVTGGPGLVAVLSSGLMGTISGSAVANTVSTGSITIPMMKNAGFRPKFSAAVETAASTGGQIMPPIMGAGAFIMAEWTQLPYATIMAVAVLPAIMYFASVSFYVYLEARKNKIVGETDADETLTKVLLDGLPFLLPIGVLVGMLIAGFTPTYSAGYAIIAVIVSSFIKKVLNHPISLVIPALFREVLDSLASGARNMVVTGLLLVAVGTVIGSINMTGISVQFSQMVIEWSGGHLLLALVLITGASLLMGMGLPVTAAYIMLAVLAAPALQNLLLMGAPAVLELMKPESLQPLLQDPQFLGSLMTVNPSLAEKAMLAMVDPTQVQALIDDPFFIQALVNSVPELQALEMGYLLTAHMIIFWVSQDSNVTPPVCLAAFAGAAIAGSPPMATGVTAWKLAKGLYIIPLLFAFTPLIHGTLFQQIEEFLFGTLGLFAFTVTMVGYLYKALSMPERIMMLGVALMLFWPLWWVQSLGLAGFVVLMLVNTKGKTDTLSNQSSNDKLSTH